MCRSFELQQKILIICSCFCDLLCQIFLALQKTVKLNIIIIVGRACIDLNGILAIVIKNSHIKSFVFSVKLIFGIL